MNESLLQHIWQHKYLLNQKLYTTDNIEISVINPGTLNLNAGPDFFNAKIKIGNTIWAGNVEIHINSSNWIDHNHQHDNAYDNVILHVVYNYDKPIFNKQNQHLATLEVKSLLSDLLIKKYAMLQQELNIIPCAAIFKLPESFKLNSWLNRLAIERLEDKSSFVFALLQKNNNHWEEVFYQVLAKYFGQKVNDEPFLLLANNLPISILAKHKNQLLQLQSLFLGVAGFLNKKPINNYNYSLYTEFRFLKNKYNLKTLEPSVWKFSKTRPANFPTVRILQMAQLIFQSSHLFSKICEANTLKQIEKLLNVNTSQQFSYSQLVPNNQNPSVISINTGKTFVNNIIINVVVPVVFSFGKHKNNQNLCNKALNWLEEVKPENNRVTKLYNKLNLNADSALKTQALLQMFTHYCTTKKCLKCAIGNHILFDSNG